MRIVDGAVTTLPDVSVSPAAWIEVIMWVVPVCVWVTWTTAAVSADVGVEEVEAMAGVIEKIDTDVPVVVSTVKALGDIDCGVVDAATADVKTESTIGGHSV